MKPTVTAVVFWMAYFAITVFLFVPWELVR